MTQPIPIKEAPAAKPEGIEVPLGSLSQPDDKEQMVTPAEGDSISMQVDAIIEKIDGDIAYIKPTAINGKPIEDIAEEAKETPEEEQQEPETISPDNAEADLRSAMESEKTSPISNG